jgi:Calx-beta domain.
MRSGIPRPTRRIWPNFIALAVLTAAALGLVAQDRSGGAVLEVREGTVRVLAADTVADAGRDHAHDHSFKGASEDAYRAVLVGDDGHVYFLAGRRHFPSNKRVRIAGTLGGSTLTAVSVDPASTPVPKAGLTAGATTTAGLPTAGTSHVLVMLAYWNSPDSVTPESAAAQMFGDSNAWYRDSSYGALGQSGVVTPWMHIDPPAGNQCYADSGSIMINAQGSAQALGYDLGTFDNFVVYFPYDGEAGSDCGGYAGWAYVGAPGTWLNGYMDRRVTVHEQGHNYGLWHAHSLLCSGPIDALCQFSEYGNDYDAMGGSGYVGHFSASQKSKLGWMDGRVQDLSAGGSTTLVPYESDSVATVAAKVDATPDRSYWVEYRQPRDFDANLPASSTDGVLVTVKDPTGPVYDDGASLLDARPGDGLDVGSATLRAGESWRSEEGIVISVASVSSSGATVTVSHPSVGALTGVVRDVHGNPLRGAMVRVDGNEIASTDGVGQYRITGLTGGAHSVEVRHICFDDRQQSVVTSTGTQSADFTLATPAAGTTCLVDTSVWESPTSVVPLIGDDASAMVALPFPYNHYGQRYATAYLSTNGVINFLAPDTEYANTSLPEPGAPNAALYPLWDDLDVDSLSSVVTGTFGTAPQRRFVVEWRNVAFLADVGHRVSVQAVLYEDPNQPVRFQYRDVDQSSLESGQSATVGIENSTGDVAIMASLNSGLLYDGLAIRLPVGAPTRASVGDAAISEGASGQRLLRFNVSLSHPAATDVRLPFHTTDGTATAGVDYTAKSGTVIIPTGRTAATVPIGIRGDVRSEPTEDFRLVLGTPVDAALGRASATGRILNDDPSNGLRVGIGDASIGEGDNGNRTLRFTVGLSGASRTPVTVDYSTGSGTARAGADFTARRGTVTIPAGATSVTVGVEILPDTVVEHQETFVVQLSSARSAALGRRTGTGRILDDD